MSHISCLISFNFKNFRDAEFGGRVGELGMDRFADRERKFRNIF